MLIIFVKAPRPGFVKTRLAQELGANGAAKAYREILSELCRRLAGLQTVELRYAPIDAGPEIAAWLGAGWIATAQGEGDLGARLIGAFAEKFRTGLKRVVVIGSDCPYLGEADVQEANAALDHSDVVLGPASDGGYWLIGLAADRPQLFENISWSTGSVLTETLTRAKELNLKVHLLRELEDIDTAESWEKFLSTR